MLCGKCHVVWNPALSETRQLPHLSDSPGWGLCSLEEQTEISRKGRWLLCGLQQVWKSGGYLASSCPGEGSLAWPRTGPAALPSFLWESPHPTACTRMSPTPEISFTRNWNPSRVYRGLGGPRAPTWLSATLCGQDTALLHGKHSLQRPGWKPLLVLLDARPGASPGTFSPPLVSVSVSVPWASHMSSVPANRALVPGTNPASEQTI